ncbi:MAG: CidA/LrgA family protein [Clostridia bacterium]|nr:CidA/LrgA family protein [Clostridia bacterium]
MKHLLQITIIAAVSLAGEILHQLIPLPIPGSIYGLVIMLLLLYFGAIEVRHVKDVSSWLLSLMPVMFIGPTVGLIVTFDSYKDFLIPIAVTVTLSTVLVMGVTGVVSQQLIRLTDRVRQKHAERKERIYFDD